MSGRRLRPPALATWLLSRLLPDDLREAILGDLEEAFVDEIVPARGAFAARLWYWRETLHAPLTLTAALPSPIRPPSGDSLMSTLFADLRYALRMLARRPGFTALATFTLALGIGATTAIFSAVNPILFEALPYPHAERLVMVWERNADGTHENVGWATANDIAQGNTSFEAVAAVGDWQATMTGRAEPERIDGQRVTSTYFRILGVAPALGRDFAEREDDRAAPRVAIISNALWRSRFGGDSSIVGKPIVLDGAELTLIGVMPAGFENVLDAKAQLWTTLRYNATLPWACRTCHHLRMIARVKPNVSLGTAARELDALHASMVRDHPQEYSSVGMALPTLHAEVTKGVRPALLAVLGAVLLVLLVACANVTNLLLARGAQRQAEFTVRAALGAGRGRVVRQLLTESLVLAGIGGALGIVVAQVGVRVLVALSPPGLPRLSAVEVNGGVLVFALGLTTLVGVGFGLIPAIHATRGDLHHGIQLGSRRNVGTSRLTRASLVVSEVALALVLLVGSGLMLRSMNKLFAVSPGFDTSHLLTLQVQTSGPRYASDTATRAFFDRALANVRALPGVASAGFTSQLPLSSDFDGYGVHIQSRPRANPEQDPSAHRYAVSAGYLEAMQIPVRRGRTLTADDRADHPPVVLVNETFAKRAFAGANPLGERVRLGDAATGPWYEIVGVVGDIKQTSLAQEPSNQVYVTEAQWRFSDGALSFVVRTRGEPSAITGAVRQAIWSVDKDQPIVRTATMETLMETTAAQRRFALVLFEAFALVALVLAAAGIYGVLAGTVTERLREIGVRAALGASRGQLLGMVVRQGLGLTAVGVAVGLGAAMALTQLIAGLLFGVSSLDVVTYAGVTGLLLVVALAACWVPAWRAARVDPAEMLRAE